MPLARPPGVRGGGRPAAGARRDGLGGPGGSRPRPDLRPRQGHAHRRLRPRPRSARPGSRTGSPSPLCAMPSAPSACSSSWAADLGPDHRRRRSRPGLYQLAPLRLRRSGPGLPRRQPPAGAYRPRLGRPADGELGIVFAPSWSSSRSAMPCGRAIRSPRSPLLEIGLACDGKPRLRDRPDPLDLRRTDPVYRWGSLIFKVLSFGLARHRAPVLENPLITNDEILGGTVFNALDRLSPAGPPGGGTGPPRAPQRPPWWYSCPRRSWPLSCYRPISA